MVDFEDETSVRTLVRGVLARATAIELLDAELRELTPSTVRAKALRTSDFLKCVDRYGIELRQMSGREWRRKTSRDRPRLKVIIFSSGYSLALSAHDMVLCAKAWIPAKTLQPARNSQRREQCIWTAN